MQKKWGSNVSSSLMLVSEIQHAVYCTRWGVFLVYICEVREITLSSTFLSLFLKEVFFCHMRTAFSKVEDFFQVVFKNLSAFHYSFLIFERLSVSQVTNLKSEFKKIFKWQIHGFKLGNLKQSRFNIRTRITFSSLLSSLSFFLLVVLYPFISLYDMLISQTIGNLIFQVSFCEMLDLLVF